jgi:hypothetical protein
LKKKVYAIEKNNFAPAGVVERKKGAGGPRHVHNDANYFELRAALRI